MNKRFNLAILQARMSSSRLPNKVLKKVNNKELLLYEIERILKSKKIDKLIVATSNDISDNKIEKFCEINKIECFRGSLNNVLSRYYNCANNFKVQNNIKKLNIIRITGDCPLIDPMLIDKVVECFEQNSYDYVSNTLEPTYPDGMDIEICKFEALEYAYNNVVLKSDKEHVTLYIKNSNKFSKYNYKASSDFSHLRLTVDEEDDFKLIANILRNLYFKNKEFSYLDIISYMSSNPYLFTINSTIKRDEGLDKSLIAENNDKNLIMQTKFNNWNKLKQQLNKKTKIVGFNEQDIVFISIGQNIGFEIYGKQDEFLRPVIVLKKLGKYNFIGIPLSSKLKEGYFYINVSFKDRRNTALLNQIRSFDAKRIKYKIGYLSKEQFNKIKKEIQLKITPLSTEGERTKAKIDNIISNKSKNVKG